MALTWVEDKSSRAATIVRLGSRGTATYVKSYKVFGTDDDVALHNEVNSQVGAALQSWTYPGTSVSLWIESYSVTYIGDKCWQVTLNYEKRGADSDEKTSPLKRSRSFDTTGGTAHITQGLITGDFPQGEQRYWNGTPAAPNQFGAIGVDDDRVGGVDVMTPSLKWSEQYEVPSTYITTAYIKQVASITGTVNTSEFRGFAKGEVLFAGSTGTHEWDADRGDGPWSLSFSFVASPSAGSGKTLPAITVGSISGISKGGHDFMWVRYEPSTDGYRKVSVPKFVYVNKVYRDGDFSKLGIGVT